MTITTSPMHDRGPGWRCSCGLGVCGGGFCAAGTWRARQRAPAMCRTTPRPHPRSTLTSASGRCRHHTPPLTHARRCARLAALMQLGVCGSGSATPHAQSTPPKPPAMCYTTPMAASDGTGKAVGAASSTQHHPPPPRPCARLAALMQLGVCGSGPDTSWGKFGQNPSPDSGSTPPSYP